MNRVIIGLIVGLVISVSVNIGLIVSRPDVGALKERIERYEELEEVQGQIVLDLETNIDSLLAIPMVNTTIIKQSIYEQVTQEYPDGTLIVNDDRLVDLWTDLARE